MKAPVGRVYVLSNPAMPGLLKIGYTMNTVEGRVKELSIATGVPTKFNIEYQVECRDPAGLEAYAHTFFQNKRYNGNREFFSISVNDAINVLRNNATELLAEELGAHANDLRQIKIPATLYLARVHRSEPIFRLGLLQKKQDFLFSQEFKNAVIEHYRNLFNGFFYDCNLIKSEEFFLANTESFEEVRSLIDSNVSTLKGLNYRTVHQTIPNFGHHLDLRTLYLKEVKESLAIQFYNSCLSLVQPIATACQDTNRSQDMDIPQRKQTLDL